MVAGQRFRSVFALAIFAITEFCLIESDFRLGEAAIAPRELLAGAEAEGRVP
jgi:hypothetical protein